MGLNMGAARNSIPDIGTMFPSEIPNRFFQTTIQQCSTNIVCNSSALTFYVTILLQCIWHACDVFDDVRTKTCYRSS